MAIIRPSEKECKHPGGIGVPLHECGFKYIPSRGEVLDKDLFDRIIRSLHISVMSKEHAEGLSKSPEGWLDFDALEFKVRKGLYELEIYPVSDDVGHVKFKEDSPRSYSNAVLPAILFDVRYKGICGVVLYLTKGSK